MAEIASTAFAKATGRPLARPKVRAGAFSARIGAIFRAPSLPGDCFASEGLTELKVVLVEEDVVGKYRSAHAELMEVA